MSRVSHWWSHTCGLIFELKCSVVMSGFSVLSADHTSLIRSPVSTVGNWSIFYEVVFRRMWGVPHITRLYLSLLKLHLSIISSPSSSFNDLSDWWYVYSRLYFLYTGSILKAQHILVYNHHAADNYLSDHHTHADFRFSSSSTLQKNGSSPNTAQDSTQPR